MPAGNAIPVDLAGVSAIVTGAGSGLGRHFALTLARAGAKVALAGRRLDRLKAVEAEIEAFDGRALPIELDVTSADSVRAGVAAAEQELGAITVLVNNSGIVVDKPALEQSEQDWDQVLATNLKGAFLMAGEVARHMVRLGHGGSIVNIASILGERASARVVGYAASKAGLIQLTRALAVEWARHNIRVNAIAPGYIETDINRDFLASPGGQAIARKVPMRRFGRPEDLEGALLLLCSAASAYMTATVITVDGGQTAAL
ncbi:MAG: glucose 1-dehydrogenase [Alphaproteobacteria bacterium]|nr:glucose 1-dehydrogenase [Alphaproteobacteria bacterium]